MVRPEMCPAESRLRKLIGGKLTNIDESEVSRHLEYCAKCQRAVEELAPAREELLPLCVNGSELKLETRDPALKQAMDRLHAVEGDESETESQSCDDDSLKILSPSDKGDSLGRLGPYEITAIIGRGGMGTVFKAIDTTLNRVVAVKILAPALASNGTARQRFVREAHSAAAVVHDHVITIHAVDETGSQPYLVMQLVAGISLQEKIDHNGPLEVKEILRIARQIAGGLAAAHEQGLVHRDIKPSNILLENGVERIKITDFGLARAVDDASITHSEVIAGTPQYMAPEQANGEMVDHRADLFSLGSVMYAMCTGRPPFRADSTIGTLRSVSDKRPRTIREVNADIPVWLVAIIDRLHEKEPANRYQSAAEVERLLGEQLARIQQPVMNSDPGDQPDNNPVSVVKQQPRVRRGSQWKLGFIAGLLILLLGLGVSELVGATKIIQTLAVVFRIESPQGTVVVEIADPTATVTLDGEEIVIGADGFKELRLKPGSYDFRAKRDGVPDRTRRVVVSRGSREIVKIGFEKRSPDETKPMNRPSAAEAEMAQARIKILEQRLQVLIQQYRVGNVTIDRVVNAANDLHKVELERAKSADQRTKTLEEQLVILKELGAVTEALYTLGESGQEDVLAVQAELLNAQAQLNRERNSPKPLKKILMQVHTCAMHPQIRRPDTGKCPICGMQLLPADRVGNAASHKVLRTVGTVSFDERHIAHIYAPAVARVERVYVDRVGVEVKKGDVLVELFSAEIHSAEEELIQALKHQKKQPQGRQASALVAAARENLGLLGHTEEQIKDIERRDKPNGRLTLFAPVNGVVTELNAKKGAHVKLGTRLLATADPTRVSITLDARESDMARIRRGQQVTLRTDPYPNDTFHGRIAFIAPVVDPKKRTVKVRVDYWSPDRKLKPGMSVRGDVRVEKSDGPDRSAAEAPPNRRSNPVKSPLWSEHGVTPGPVAPLTAKVLQWIGLNLRPITKNEFRDENVFADYPGGLGITFARSHGPAEKAGINGSDILVGLQGQPLATLQDLDAAVKAAVGQIVRQETGSLEFNVLRVGVTLRVNIPLPAEKLGTKPPGALSERRLPQNRASQPRSPSGRISCKVGCYYEKQRQVACSHHAGNLRLETLRGTVGKYTVVRTATLDRRIETGTISKQKVLSGLLRQPPPLTPRTAIG